MKKIFVAVLLLSLATSVFAVDISFGAGGSVGLLTWQDIKGTAAGTSAEIVERAVPIDVKVFADVTIFQFSFGYMFLVLPYQATTLAGTTTTTSLDGYTSYLTFAAYAKYPFAVGPISIFPLIGLEYRLNLTWGLGPVSKDSLPSAEQASLNELWLQGGAGMDISFGAMYVRTEVLLGFKPNLGTYDNDLLQAFAAASPSISYFNANVDFLIGVKL